MSIQNPFPPLVLYGAGKNASIEIDKVKKLGFEIVCFCDTDVKKHGTTFLGLPIMGLEKVAKIYKEFNVWVTVADFHTKCSIFQYLLEKGISKERIENWEEYEIRTSCYALENFMCVFEHRLTHCCYSGEEITFTQETLPGIDMSGDLEESIIRFMKNKKKLVEQFKKDITSTPCYGCNNLVKKYFKKADYSLDIINFALFSPCQLSCYYCDARNSKNKITHERDILINNFNYKKFFEILKSNNFLSENLSVILATGEITILPNKDKLLNEVQDYPLSIYTNAVTFDRRIAKLKTINYMSISVDAGTSKTYETIKGSNAFDNVWNNIKKYKEQGINIVVKYIFLPENSNEADITGFIDNILEAGISSIEISADAFRRDYYNIEICEYIIKMIKLCNKHNIQYHLWDNLIGSKNMESINKVFGG